MEQIPKVGPRDFFSWLAATAALYVSVASIIAIWFEIIDRTWGTQDPYAYVDPYSSGMRVAVSSLIVIFPLYVWFMRRLHNEIRVMREKRELWIRRWALVFTLFLGGIIMAVDLIVLLSAFLGGEELTTSFLLKVLAVFVIVGGTFWYYIEEIRGTWEWQEKRSLYIAGAAALLVILSIASTFYFLGSPRSQRLLRYDNQKISDLQNLQWQITEYWQQKEVLPKDFAALTDPIRGYVLPEDPQSKEGMVYEYEATGKLSFTLCATFNTEQKTTSPAEKTMPAFPRPGLEVTYWNHGVGRTCFERTIDPDLFPPYSKR